MRKKLFYEFIGEKIRQKREEKGVTINELSLKTGIRKIYLQKIDLFVYLSSQNKNRAMKSFWNAYYFYFYFFIRE